MVTEVYIGSLVGPIDWPLEAYFDLPSANANYFEGHVRHCPMCLLLLPSGLHLLSLICTFVFEESFVGWLLKLAEKQERNSDSMAPDELLRYFDHLYFRGQKISEKPINICYIQIILRTCKPPEVIIWPIWPWFNSTPSFFTFMSGLLFNSDNLKKFGRSSFSILIVVFIAWHACCNFLSVFDNYVMIT